MQRLLTVAMCLAAIAAVAYVQIPSATTLWGSISPWGVGVVFGSLLLAVIAGEVARFAKLPRVFAYAAVGVLAVPLHGGILRPTTAALADPADFFQHWQVIFSTAVALTGLAVGLHFDLPTFRSHLRAIWLHAVGHLVLVASVMFALVWWASFEVNHPLFPDTYLPIIVIALLAATSSPTAIYSVNTDLRADGKLPQLQLLIAVCKNAMLLVGVALVAYAGPDGFEAALETIPFETVATDAASTLLGGAIAGLVLLGALRWGSEQVVVFAFSLCVVSAIAFSDQYLQLFGSAFLGGLIVTNGSRFGFQLADSLDRSSPFFLGVVFVFAIVNVRVSLEPEVWLFAAATMPIRAVAMFVASRAATFLSSGAGGRHLAYSMFAQSLVAMFALDWLHRVESDFASVSEVVGPFVLVNLLAGSLLHRFALVRSGYATEVEAVTTTDADVIIHSGPIPVLGERSLLDDDRSLLPEPQFRAPAFRSERLNRITLRIRQRLMREQDSVAQRFFAPRRAFVENLITEVRRQLHLHCVETFDLLCDVSDPEQRRQLIRDRRAALEGDQLELYLVFGPTHEPGALETSLKALIEGVDRACQVEAQVRAPEEDVSRRPAPTDSRYQRIRKRFHAVNTRFGPRPARVVPVRALALHHLAHGLAERLGPAVNLDGRFRIYVWQRLSNAFGDVSEMYVRTLERLDEEIAELDRASRVIDQAAAARETEALAEFDRRLHEAGTTTEDEEPSDGIVEPLLEDEASLPALDVIVGAWSQLIVEVPQTFDDLERDVLDHEADVRRRLALTVDAVYQAFVDDLAIAGTSALPARTFESATRAAAATRGFDDLEARITHWRRLALAFVDRRSMELGFRDVEHRLRGLLGDFVVRVETELCSHLTYYPAEISERCDDVVEALNQTFNVEASDTDLGDAFVQIRHSLSDFLQDEALRSVQEMREEQLFAELVRQFIEKLIELARDQRSLFIIADESYLDRADTASARDIVAEDVPFQEILEKYLVQTCVASFNELAMRVRTVVDEVATGLGEVNRIISFNLDAAAGELRLEDPDPSNRDLVAEFAVGGIRRAGENASELLQQVQDEVDGIDDAILELTVAHVRTVRRYLFDSSMGRLEKLALEVERDRSDFQERGFAILRGVTQQVGELAETVAQPARVAADLLVDRFSLQEHDRDALVADTAIAAFDWEQLHALPLAYRRLFTPTPVEIPELFVTRTAEHDALLAAVRRWRDERKVSVVVTGSFGTGKTSFLHRGLAETLSDVKMLRWNVRERLLTEKDMCSELCRLFGVRRVDSVNRLLAALADVRGQRVVVVDGMERLFLRAIGGSAALNGFLSLISQSPREILWLVSANAPLWNYLATMFSADDFFTDRIDLEPFSLEQTEDLILRRHRVSGYDLTFRADETETFTPKRFREGAQDRLQRRYFKRLWDATRGHPLTALYYWLSSLEVTDDTLFVNPLRPLRTDHLRRLDDDKLIGLGQLLIHEELTEEDFATVMRSIHRDARRDLAYFEAMNLIVREPGRKLYFRVNEVLHDDLARTLTERNLL